MSSIAEFYSRNLATEVIKGCVQKAKQGGTPGKAPVGYLNVRQVLNGLEGRTVEVDPVRGPLMAWAFEAYATGEWTIRPLLAELTDRGLLTSRAEGYGLVVRAVLDAVREVMVDQAEPMRVAQVHAAVEALLGERVSANSVSWVLASHSAGPSPLLSGWRGAGMW
jgi:hypothetical protein